MNRIRPLAICLFCHKGRFLAAEERRADGERFYRPLGGGIEFGETSEQALRREIREELGAEIADPRLLGVMENRFVAPDGPGHEIVFLYDAQFVDEPRYAEPFLQGYDDDREAAFRAVWLPLEALTAYAHPIYPEGMATLLTTPPKGAAQDG